jgi:phosphoserine phosphatase RsbU/P
VNVWEDRAAFARRQIWRQAERWNARAGGYVDTVGTEWLEQIGRVLESLNQGVIVSDELGRIVVANSLFLEMIKMPAAELLGRTAASLYPPEDVPRLEELIARRQVQGRAQYEFYMPQAGGTHLPILVTARRITDSGGRSFGVVTATDISEQKRAEAGLRNANVMLEARQSEIEQANARLEARQREIEGELLLAERVQQSLAPQRLTWGGLSVETYYQPVRSIGGDYGLITPSDRFLNLLVCDVSGHGISSALVANRIYTESISQIEREVALGDMMRHLNHFVVQTLGSSAFYFTMAAARFRRDGRSIEFAGAGHPPAMIIRPGQSPQLLESRSMVLGLFEQAVDGEAVVDVPVEKGDRVLLYTDGLTESFNASREMLGVEGLGEIAREASLLPLAEMKDDILDHVAWRNGPAEDDVSLVLVEVS